MSRSVLTLVLCFIKLSIFAQISEHIHLDQFGYLPDAEKVAVLSDPQIGFNSSDSYTAGALIELRDFGNDEVVFSAAPVLWNSGQTHAQSGDRGWWLDFSSVTTEGTYYLFDPTTSEQSAPFEIKENPYEEVMQAAGRMFFYNRCNFSKEEPYAHSNWTDPAAFGNAGQDFACRNVAAQNDASTERDLSGGWFDAGDCNKYVTFAGGTINNLLWAYLENPQAFSDEWNIPESGNGIPDLLDEVKYELDWLMKMNDPTTGATLLKVGSRNHQENNASPPSENFDPRFYIGECSSAAASVAATFSLAAKIFGDFPQLETFTTELLERAMVTWNYGSTRFFNEDLDEDCDWGQIVAGDADRSIQEQTEDLTIAAIYLFDLTGEEQYAEFADTNVPSTTQVENAYWDGYKIAMNDALLYYSNIRPSSLAEIHNSWQQSIQSDVSNFFSWDELDLYRGQMPDWSYHWGSNQIKAQYGVLNKAVSKVPLFANPVPHERKANELLHYFHGLNPLGLVYLSNMYEYGGDRCADEIYHQWFANGSDLDNVNSSSFGPAPGYLAGGPNSSYSGTLSPPAEQPIQKSYAQFNDFENVSWEITEPAIYYNAAYIRLLANFVISAEPITSGIEPSAFKNALQISPNPSEDYCTLSTDFQSYVLEISDAAGKILLSEIKQASQLELNFTKYQDGVYFIKLVNEKDGSAATAKFVKQ